MAVSLSSGSLNTLILKTKKTFKYKEVHLLLHVKTVIFLHVFVCCVAVSLQWYPVRPLPWCIYS